MLKFIIYILFPFYLYTSDLEVSREDDKMRIIEQELDKMRREISTLKEELKKKAENSEQKDTKVQNTFPEATKSIQPTKPQSTAESSTPQSRPVKTYEIKSKGLKLKELDENNGGKRHAIVIGINNYQDTGISDLSKARNDAKLVGKILKDQGEFEQVFIMTDDIDPRNDKDNLYPTKLNIEEKLDSLLRFSDPDDLIVFFFSGHGISDPDENGYLVTVDTVTDKQFNTSLRINDVVQRLKSKGIKKSLLVLDACRDVLYSSKSSSRNSLLEKEYTESEVSATFYSTKAGYYSYEDDETDYGVFTKYLVMGMEGKADSNADGVVAFSELEQYVQKGVKEWSTRKNKQQKPFTRLHGEKTGDLAITFSNGNETSLVDKPIPKNMSRGDILVRSILLPGWGQYYVGSEKKGISFFSSMVLFSGYFAYAMNNYSNAQATYNSTYALPGTEYYTTSQIFLQQARRNLQESRQQAVVGAGAITALWTLNLLDASFITDIPKQEFFSLGIKPNLIPLQGWDARSYTMEGYAYFNYTGRF
jgi:hypothetical protein